MHLIINKSIDKGNAFDWGRTSKDYAKYRDIYPDEFYKRIVSKNLCVNGQKILDLGTGTAVLPRNLYKYGGIWTASDISENQIKEAERLSKENDMNIDFIVSTAEEIDFPDSTFDVVTACQCFWYFDHKKLVPNLFRMLKKDGRLLILYMAWLPFEDKIAGESEKLVLKYNPDWSGARETKHPIEIPDCVYECFELVSHEEYLVKIPFTKATWHGRMKACRGVGASLDNNTLVEWEKEHLSLLDRIAPEKFEVLHYCASAELKVRK